MTTANVSRRDIPKRLAAAEEQIRALQQVIGVKEYEDVQEKVSVLARLHVLEQNLPRLATEKKAS